MSHGVIVVGHTPNTVDVSDAGLMTADTVHSVNGAVVTSVEQPRAAVDRTPSRSPVVLRIERSGHFVFLAFELD